MTRPIAPGVGNLPPSPPKQGPKIDLSQVDPKVLESARGMETMFLDYMMQAMRKTVPKNEMDLESPATKIYRGLLDTEYAKQASRAGGVGLTEQIIEYLHGIGYNLGRKNGTGGTP